MNYQPSSQQETDFLAAYDPSKFPITVVTVDLVVIATDIDSVLLVRRGGYPYRGHFALPGGFINPDETTEDAAIRELAEETSLEFFPEDVHFLCVADKPDRDPRGRAISHVFATTVNSRDHRPKAGDDATEVHWARLSDVQNFPMAFDHLELIDRAASIYRKRMVLR